VFNLYDLTGGNYRVFRAVSYPEFPDSLILFEVDVVATGEKEWTTQIYLSGTYSGPTDVVATESYQLDWRIDDRRLLESGSATLALSSGERIRQHWTSIITPTADSDRTPAIFERFPLEGQLVSASISPFEVDGRSMGYEWQGTVRKQGQQGYGDPRE
jgi:hypothetical protein